MPIETTPSPPRRPAFRARFALSLLGFVLAGGFLPALAAAHPSPAVPGDSRSDVVAECNHEPTASGLGCCLLHALSILDVAAPEIGEAGMRVEWDAESGQLGAPTGAFPERLSGLEAAMVSREASDLIPEMLPGGGLILNLRGRFQSLSLATRLPNGRLRTGCEDTELGVLQWFHSNPPASDPAGWPEE